MKLDIWTRQFRKLYDKALDRYGAYTRKPATFFTKKETEFLASIGLAPIHVYDYAEDFLRGGEPDFETALLMVAARRDYFLYQMGGKPARKMVSMEDLPPKDAACAGIVWLPRILPKARGFLEGTLAPEIMYCCGGDRNFLKTHGIHPADFLRAVWGAKGDDKKILKFVKTSAARAA